MIEKTATLSTDSTMTDITIDSNTVVKVGEVGDTFNIQVDGGKTNTIYRYDQSSTPVDFSNSFTINTDNGDAIPTTQYGLYFAHSGTYSATITVEKV